MPGSVWPSSRLPPRSAERSPQVAGSDLLGQVGLLGLEEGQVGPRTQSVSEDAAGEDHPTTPIVTAHSPHPVPESAISQNSPVRARAPMPTTQVIRAVATRGWSGSVNHDFSLVQTHQPDAGDRRGPPQHRWDQHQDHQDPAEFDLPNAGRPRSEHSDDARHRRQQRQPGPPDPGRSRRDGRPARLVLRRDLRLTLIGLPLAHGSTVQTIRPIVVPIPDNPHKTNRRAGPPEAGVSQWWVTGEGS